MIKRYPGFIDVHVHLREPGATQKEDFATGSRAAVKGGFTFIIDMPNNPTPTFTSEALAEKIQLSKTTMCDIGFHYGTNGKNTETFSEIWNNPLVFGLKLYCNHTTGDYLIEDPVLLEKVFASWNSQKPILVHAEGAKLELTVSLAKKYNRYLHVCHISQKSEVQVVKNAKKTGQLLTAGATPHHLFMTATDVETKGSYAMMKPPLGSQEDQDALWDGIIDGTIDIVETDHAPHTKEEKAKIPPPNGVPGLETAVGLLWSAVHDARIEESMVKTLLYDNPKKIFNIPDQKNTYVDLDPDQEWIVGKDGYETKCGWSPWEGTKLYGKVMTVVLHGKTVIKDGGLAL